jgi:hypothetical protein
MSPNSYNFPSFANFSPGTSDKAFHDLRAINGFVQDQLRQLPPSKSSGVKKDGDFVTVFLKYIAFTFLLDRSRASGLIGNIPCVTDAQKKKTSKEFISCDTGRDTKKTPHFLESNDRRNVIADLVAFFMGIQSNSVHLGIRFLRYVIEH